MKRVRRFSMPRSPPLLASLNRFMTPVRHRHIRMECWVTVSTDTIGDACGAVCTVQPAVR